MKRLLSTFIVGVLLLLASPAWGGDLYVGAAATGDESGSGVGNLCTLATANSSLVAGETAYILDTGGNYVDQSIDPANSGSSGNPITYEAYTGDAPILIGTGVYKATSHSSASGFGIRALIHIGTDNDGRSYITIKGITVQEPNHRWFHVEDSDHIIFEDCTFNESLTTYNAYAKSCIHSSSYLYFDGCLWDGSNQTSGGFDNLGNYYSHHYVFLDCTFEEAAHSSFEDLSISSGASTYGVFKNSTVENTWHSGATFGGLNAKYYLVEGCTFKNGGSADNPFDPGDAGTDPALYMFCQRSIVRNNTFYSNNTPFNPRSSSPFGDYSYNWIYHNTIYDTKERSGQSPVWNTGTSIIGGPADDLDFEYNHILNNIIWKTENLKQITLWRNQSGGPYPSNNTIENNLIGDPTNPSLISWGTYFDSSDRKGTVTWQDANSSDGWANNKDDLDPLMIGPDSQDFTLSGDSPAVDGGRFLATIASVDGNELTLGTNEAYAFFDGWGLDSNYVTADTIYDDDGSSTTVVSIDAHNIITVADATNFAATDKITTIDYDDDAPDIGANERTIPPPPDPGQAGNITFWWRCEAADFSGTNGTLDYSAGDDTGTANSEAAINTDAVVIGTNGLDCPTPGDRMEFDVAADDIVDADEGRIGVWFKWTTWKDANTLFRVYEDGDNSFFITMYSADGLRWYWEDGGTARTTISITDADLADAGTAYFIEAAWKVSTDYRELFVNGVSRGSDATTIGTFAPIRLDLGEATGGTPCDYYLDNIMISSDSTDDLYELRNEPDYPATGGAPAVQSIAHCNCSTGAALGAVTYVAGEEACAKVVGDEDFHVAGTFSDVTLTMDCYPSDVVMSYKSGGYTKEMIMGYIVQAGDRITDFVAESGDPSTALSDGDSQLTDIEANNYTVDLTGIADPGAITLAATKLWLFPGVFNTYTLFEAAMDALAGDVFLLMGTSDNITAELAGTTFHVYGHTGNFDADNLAITIRGKNRITGTISNSGSATLTNLLIPMIIQ